MPDDLEPTGHTIFCDDIRVEQNGQFSLIGVYPGGIVVHTPFPATIPKFAFSVIFSEPYELALRRDFPVSIRIYLPGEVAPIFEGTISAHRPEALSALLQGQLPLSEPDREVGPPVMLMVSNIILTQMVVREPGLIRVRISYDVKTIRSGTLKVMAAATAIPPNATS